MTMEADLIERRTWRDVIEPLANRFDIAAKFNQSAVWNAIGSKAMAELMREMAFKLDRGDDHYIPRAEASDTIAALQARVEKLEEALEQVATHWNRAVAMGLHDEADRVDGEDELLASILSRCLNHIPGVVRKAIGDEAYYAVAVPARAALADAGAKEAGEC